MRLNTVQRYWDGQANVDPMWAILTDPEKAGRRWNPDEFFATGVREIGLFMNQARPWGVPVSSKFRT